MPLPQSFRSFLNRLAKRTAGERLSRRRGAERRPAGFRIDPVAALEDRVVPANASWTGGTLNADWADPGNWSANPVPGTGDTATFNAAAGVGGATISLAGVTVGTVLFDTVNAAGYTLGASGVGGQTLTFDNTGAVTMNGAVANTQSFNANILLGTAIGGTTTLTNNSLTNSLTFNGTMQGGTGGTAGAKTLSVAGGGNTTIGGIIANGGASSLALAKTGLGTLTLTAANTYTGSTVVNSGTLQLSGANGATTGATAYTLNGGSVILDNTAAAGGDNANRIANTSNFTLNGGSFIYKGSDAGNSTETIGNLSGVGSSTITLTYGGSNLATLTAGTFTHAAGNATLLVNGLNLGKNSTDTANVARFISTAPTLTGTTNPATTGINAAAQDTKIVPFLVGEATSSTGGLGTSTGTPNTFLTYVAGSGYRPLNPTDEFTNNAIASGKNTYITSATSANTTSINSLVIAGADLTINDGQTLTDTSGAVLFTTSNAIKPSSSTGILAFSNVEPQITVNSGATGTISAVVSGSAGLTKSGPGILSLSGSTANTYTGTTTVNLGTLALDKSGGVNALTGALTIGSTSSPAAPVVQYTGSSTDMMGTGAVTINSAGQLDFNGKTDTIGNVTIVATGSTGNTTPIINTAGNGNLTIGTLGITPTAGFTSQINTGTGTLTLGGTVTFTAATTGQAKISGNLALGATRTFNVGAGTGANHDLLIDAAISGTGFGLTKDGAGTLVLSNSGNSYSGGTVIKNGTLRSGANDVLPDTITLGSASGTNTMTLDLNGNSDSVASITYGTFDAGGAANITTGAGTLTLNGNINANDTNTFGPKSISGNLNLGGAVRTVTIGTHSGHNGWITISALVSNGGFIQAGNNYGLILSGANTYGSGTTLTSGRLQLAGGNVGSVGAITSSPIGTGTLTFNGGTISSDGATARTILNPVAFTNNGGIGNATNNGALTFSDGINLGGSNRTITVNSNAQFDGIVTNGGISKAGAGTLTLNNTGNNFTGGFGASAGILRSGASNVLPDTGALAISGTGTIDLAGYSDSVASIYLGANNAGETASITTGTGTLTLNGNFSTDTNSWGDNLISGNLDLGAATRNFNLGNNGNFPKTMTISANISNGGINYSANSVTTLVLSGMNTFTGPTTANTSGSKLVYNSVGAFGLAAGRHVTVANGAVVAAGYAIDNSFLNHIVENSNTSVMALGANSANNLDFSSSTGATLPNASLGAIGSYTYGGTLTPNGTTYRLGGGGGTLTMGSVMTGGSSTVINGNVNLAAANNYAGNTTLTAGNANLGIAENVGVSGPLGNPTTPAGSIVFGGGTLQYSAVNQFDYSARITGTGNNAYKIDTNGQNVTFATGLPASGSSGLTKSGLGTLTLNGNNTYTGATTVSGGILELTGNNSGSNSAPTITGATLRATAANSLPTGNLTIGNNGTLELRNNSSTVFTAPSVIGMSNNSETIGNGTIFVGPAVGSSATGGTHTLTRVTNGASRYVTVAGANGYSLIIGTYDRSDGNNNYLAALTDVTINQFNGAKTRLYAGSGANLTVVNAATNTADFVEMNGIGTVTFSSTFGGNASISVTNGLTKFNATKTGTGNVAVSAGSLTGTGTINTNLTVSGSGGVNFVDGAVAATPLTVSGNLAITGNAGANNLKFDLGAAAAGTDKIVVTGTTTVTNAGAAVVTMNQIGGIATPSTPGTYTLIDGTGAMDPVTDFALATTKAFGQTFTLGVASNDLQVTTAAGTAGPAAAFWKGGVNNWSTAANWNTDATSNVATGAIPGYGTNVTFYTTNPAAANLTTNTVDVDFDINSLNYSTAATANTTIGGSKMLTIEATSVNGNTAGRGITVATPSSGTPTHTIIAKVGLAANQTWFVDTGARLTVSGVTSDFDGGRTLTKDGAGTLTLSGASNNYLGGTVVNAGTLVNGTGGGVSGALTINAGGIVATDQQYSSSSASALPQTININGGEFRNTKSGIGNTDFYVKSIDMTGGNLTTTGATPNFYSFFDTYGKNLPINTHASSSVATISGAIAARNITGITFTTEDGTTPSGVDLVVSGPLFYESRNGNNWGVTKEGAGVVAITSNNHGTSYVFNTGGGNQNGAGYGLATTINAGTLQLGNNTSTGSLNPASAIVNNATLAFKRTDILTQGTDFSSVISGSGAVVQTGSGTTILNGVNTYAGATTVDAGKLTIASTGNINSTSDVNINGGNFNYNSATAFTKSITFSGTGGTLSGSGTINTAVNVTSGNFLAPGNSAGTLTFGNNLTIAGTANFEITGNAAANTYDKAVLSGGVLDYTGGTLSVTFTTPGGTPTAAGTYTLFSGFGSTVGTFGTVTLPMAPGGFQWKDFDAGMGVDYFDEATGTIVLESAVVTKLSTIAIDNGSALAIGTVRDGTTGQGSIVRSITVVFDGVISTAPASAFALTDQTNASISDLTVNVAGTGTSTLTLTFSDSSGVNVGPVTYDSLSDLKYRLKIDGSQLVSSGNQVDADGAGGGGAGSTGTQDFTRLFGDYNNNAFVDATDLYPFLVNSIDKGDGDPGYQRAFDYNNNNFVDATDIYPEVVTRIDTGL